MLYELALDLSDDPSVTDDELCLCVKTMDEEIRSARKTGEPAPFIAYRNLIIFEIALADRTRFRDKER